MSVYILSNANQVLGVFSSPIEAQKYYSNIVTVSQQGTSTVSQQGTIKLEGFTLNKTPGIDMTLLLKKGVGAGNKRRQTIIMEESGSKKDKYSYRIFDPTPFQDNIYECYNCGGEDCRDGCVNDNYDF
jgi:hypothetical protein